MSDALPALGGDIAATINNLPSLSAKMSDASIDKAAQNFESLFATELLQPMFEGVGVDATFGGGHGEEVMKTFMLQEYGKIIAQSGRLGIAAQVKSEMLRAQESAGKLNRTTTAAAQNAYAQAALTSGGAHVSVQ